MSKVVTAILGGGQGARLYPLTELRAKPAVPMGGKFRLIDIPISNSIRSDFDQIYVLTQFNSASLHRHISQTYRFDAFSSGFVNILAAEQTGTSREWYQGTADAVRQMLFRLTADAPDEVLILSGDQLYLMPLEKMIETHRSNDADVTVAVTPVPRSDAPGFGVMHLDGTSHIAEFVEKPQEDEVLDHFSLTAETIAKADIPGAPGELLASMGIYVFKTEVLVDLLETEPGVDFGKEIIPVAVRDRSVFGYVYDGYWRDIGTIGSFHQANIELTLPVPPLDLYDPDYPIYTHPRFLPGAKVGACDISATILCDGSIVDGATLRDSVIGVRGRVRSGSTLERTLVMGAGYYEAEPPPGLPGVGVGHGCEIRNAILDVNARIGDNVRIINAAGVKDGVETDTYAIRDGVVVIKGSAVIPPGTVI
ncbi:MAG: glucose-1-phosphate adenylyltransferase [Acidimicrobiia bacterium]|nr:glucose-1-phosphate adenylyltransferase [Acidimicrobiia bacterium]NNF69585.1 glucose-1-phosphate adenylyltransferase [Acidimicrobiia bacterium]